MTLFSDAIEYFGANDDNEMCIDLNMRMQSILVRPYILDCLCEHNEVSKKEQELVQERFGSDDAMTNFESDQRREHNPYKYKEQIATKEEEKYAKAESTNALKTYVTKSNEKEMKEMTRSSVSSTKFVGIISQAASPGVREIPRNDKGGSSVNLKGKRNIKLR